MVLDTAALVMVSTSPLVSATLLAAAYALRERTHEPRVPAEARYIAERLRIAGVAPSDPDLDASHQRGLTLSDDEALSMVESFVQAEAPPTRR
jgi:hypothetical protein